MQDTKVDDTSLESTEKAGDGVFLT